MPRAAGYSGTPLAKKLGIDRLPPGTRAFLEGAPASLDELFAPLVRVATVRAPLTYVHLFATERAKLAARLPKVAAALEDRGMAWVSWPKKAARVVTDVDEACVRELGLATGLVDVKVCAVDEVWSGLKFVRRVADRT